VPVNKVLSSGQETRIRIIHHPHGLPVQVSEPDKSYRSEQIISPIISEQMKGLPARRFLITIGIWWLFTAEILVWAGKFPQGQK
jgi:hypothetical protein